MIKQYQNSVIAQLLQAIIGQINFDGEPISNIGDILLSILEQTPYDKEPKSVLAELFLKLKAKIENEPFTPYDKAPQSAIAEILLSILNETEYDKDPNSRIAELLLELKAELESYAELTASGAIANFTTSVVKPLVNLTAYFNATQEAGTPTPSEPKAISGVSAVNAFHTGANLFDKNSTPLKTGYYISNSSVGNQPNYADNSNYNVYAIKVSPNTAYTFGLVKANAPQWATIDKNGIITRCENSNGGTEGIYKTITTQATDCYILFSIAVSGTYKCDDVFQLEQGSQATTYKPFVGEYITVALGGTYYGGYVTQDKNGKRELVVTSVLEHINLTGKTYSTANGFDRYLIPLSYPSTGGSYTSGKKCSVLGTYAYNEQANEHFYIYTTTGNAQGVFYFAENTFRSGEFDVLYPLAEPFTVELPDGEPITAFNGVNNVYNDSGDTSVTYLAKIEDNLNATAKFRAEVKALKEKEKEDIKEDVKEDVKDLEPVKDSGETKR